MAELARFAWLPSAEPVRVFVEETARAFLNRRDDDPDGALRYALRHQSLRDLLTGNIPVRPDLQGQARVLTAQVQAAHRQITSALTPPGEPGARNWEELAGPYACQHLAAHAAACGELDTLASDPGFLLTADPGAVLAQRELADPGRRARSGSFRPESAWLGKQLPPRPAWTAWTAWPSMPPGSKPPHSPQHALSPGASLHRG